MGSFLENLYDVLFQPGAAMRRIAADKPVCQAVGAFLLSVLIPAGAVYYTLKSEEMNNTPYFLLLATLCSLLAWFVGAAVLSLVAEFFGGHGTAKGLFTAMGFAQVPRILIVPLLMLAMLLPAGATGAVVFVAMAIALVWTLTLDVAAIKGAHELSTARALLVLFTPLAMALVVLLIMITVLIIAGSAFLPGRSWL